MKLDVKELISKITNTPMVVEQGKNGDWNYRKWSNGMLEQWARLDQSNSATQHSFNGTYPIAFIEQPTLVASGGNYGNIDSGVRYCNATATAYDVYVTATWSAGAYLNAYVIGKWK